MRPTQVPTAIPTAVPTESPKDEVKPFPYRSYERPMRPTTPVPTTKPIAIPTESPKDEVKPFPYRSYVSFQWSILPNDSVSAALTASSSNEYNKGLMANWFLQQFLCQQKGEIMWLANQMDILKNDCRHVAATAAAAIDDVSYHSLVSSHRIILWNEPIATWHPQQLLLDEDQHIPYEVWNIQYPLFYADWVQEEAEEQELYYERIQDKLRALLNDQIQMEQLQSDRGMMSIVGRELETYLLSNSGSNSTHAPTAVLPNISSSLSDLCSYLPSPLVLIGALIIVVHTLILFCLHFYIRPYLQKSNAKTRFEQAGSTNNTTKSNQSSEDDPLRKVWLQLPQDDTRDKSSHHPLRPNTFLVDATTSVPSLLSPQMPNDDDSDWLTMSRSYSSALEIYNEDDTGKDESDSVSVLEC